MVIYLQLLKFHEIYRNVLLLLQKQCNASYLALYEIQYRLLDNCRLCQYQIPENIK